jgi:hypothetical protein
LKEAEASLMQKEGYCIDCPLAGKTFCATGYLLLVFSSKSYLALSY